MATDPLNRAFQPTVPDDTLDPPRFSQGVETTKDAFVLELKRFFREQSANPGVVTELPTIEKYAVNPSTTDPYETVVQILRKYPGIPERLPHVMVMAASGRQMPLTIGPPVMGAVQDPPRIVTAAEPFDLSRPNTNPAQDGLALVVETQPGLGRNKVYTSTLVFLAERCNDITAVTADELAQMINEQALYVHASVVAVQGGNAVQLATGGPYGKALPSRIEVLPASAPSVVAALGLGLAGTGDAIGGSAPNLTLTDAGAAFVAGNVGANLTLTGSTSTYFNDGRFPITAVGSPTSLTFTNKYGVPEAFTGSWFIGARDDSFNPARPPKNRYAYAWDIQVTVEVIAPNDNVRTELMDIVGGFFSFFLEQKFFTFTGRSVQAAPPAAVGQNESYQIVIKSDVNMTGESEVPRPDDLKDKLMINGYTVSVHTTMYLDRDVVRPGGPNAGTGWYPQPSDFAEDEALPSPS